MLAKTRWCPPESSQKMHEALIAAGVSSRRIEFEEETHLSMSLNLDTVDHCVEFYNEVLKRDQKSDR